MGTCISQPVIFTATVWFHLSTKVKVDKESFGEEELDWPIKCVDLNPIKHL